MVVLKGQLVAEFTYSVLGDDVGGVSFCFIFFFCGGAKHLKQLLYSVLQQPINQSLQQRQLSKKKKKFLLRRSNRDAITKSLNLKPYKLSCSELTRMP